MADKDKAGAPEAAVEKPAGTPTSVEKPALHQDVPVGSLTVGALTELVRVAVRNEVGAITGGRIGSHANSGPTGHSNVPGHANFTRSALDPAIAATPQIVVNPALRAGTHANSGPTGHSNVPGHANFTRSALDPAIAATPQIVVNPALRAGVHANSGPTGHSNVPGHADFTTANLGTKRTLPALHLTLQDGTQINVPEGGPSVITVAGIRITRG